MPMDTTDMLLDMPTMDTLDTLMPTMDTTARGQLMLSLLLILPMTMLIVRDMPMDMHMDIRGVPDASTSRMN